MTRRATRTRAAAIGVGAVAGLATLSFAGQTIAGGFAPQTHATHGTGITNPVPALGLAAQGVAAALIVGVAAAMRRARRDD